MPEEKDFEILNCMKTYGGSFVSSLAELCYRADPINYQKLKKAFPEYFLQYLEMVQLNKVKI